MKLLPKELEWQGAGCFGFATPQLLNIIRETSTVKIQAYTVELDRSSAGFRLCEVVAVEFKGNLPSPSSF